VATDQLPPPRDTVTERYGPRVHRAVHHGAFLLLAGALVFVGAMIVAQVGYGSSYSLKDNFISDLGAAHCGEFNASGSAGRYVCSPWNAVFDVGIIVMGLCAVFAVILLRTAFPVRRSRTVGLILLGLMGLGSIGVGFSPEDVNVTVHSICALCAFLGGALGLMVLGFAMFRDTRWGGFRTYTMVSGLVSFVALVLFLTGTYAGLGVGGMERLIVAPVLLWSVVVGVHLARIPTFAPRLLPKSSEP